MKKSKVIFFILLLLISIVLIGCSRSSTSKKETGLLNNSQSTSKTVKTGKIIHLKLWSYYSAGWKTAISAFEQSHPNIKITVKTFSFDSYSKSYLNALTKKQGPDLMIFDSGAFSNFNSLDALVDLTKAPYSASKYKGDFPKSLWQVGYSFDGKRLIGIPFDTVPEVTYYRADIMKKFGFPSDPTQLGDFMENPKHWLQIAETLKQHNKFIMQWTFDPIAIYDSSTGLFNRNMQFLRTGSHFDDAINLDSIATGKGLAANADVWNETGQSLLKNNQLVMLYLGAWGTSNLEKWVPNQKGKWRVTRLPFNLYGWSGSSIISIPKNSKHKKAAWEFIHDYAFSKQSNAGIGQITGYLKSTSHVDLLSHQSDYLGGEYDQKLYENLGKKMKEPILSPLDSDAYNIWQQTISSGIDKQLKPTNIIKNVESNLNKQLGEEINILKTNNN